MKPNDEDQTMTTPPPEIVDQLEQPAQQTDPALTCLPLQAGFLDASLADWLSAVGTVGATLVALGLAWASYRSRKQENERARTDALKDRARVYGWASAIEPRKDHGAMVWIRNDTDLPVHHLTYIAFTEKARGKGLNYQGGLMLAPGETRTLTIDAKWFVIEGIEEMGHRIHILLVFTDADGYLWARHPNGDLTPYPFEGETRLPVTPDMGTPAPFKAA